MRNSHPIACKNDKSSLTAYFFFLALAIAWPDFCVSHSNFLLHLVGVLIFAIFFVCLPSSWTKTAGRSPQVIQIEFRITECENNGVHVTRFVRNRAENVYLNLLILKWFFFLIWSLDSVWISEKWLVKSPILLLFTSQNPTIPKQK